MGDLTMVYFAINAAAYETTRHALDAALQLPAGETTYEPLASARKNAAGQVLLATGEAYAEQADVAAAIARLTASGDLTGLTQEQWQAALPKPHTPSLP